MAPLFFSSEVWLGEASMRMMAQRTNAAREPAATRPHMVAKVPSLSNQARLRQLSAPRIQAKLEIGALDDPLEREADRVADQVMRIPDPTLSVSAVPLQVSRKCAACEEEGKQNLQMKPGSMSGPEAGHAPAMVPDVLQSRGRPLLEDIRRSVEPRFGRDFSSVRVHTEVAESEDPARIGAMAYTVGKDIVFARNFYKPYSEQGQYLLAHELTHVVQQGSAPSLSTGTSPAISAAGSPRPQFGLFNFAKCTYYTYKMKEITANCRAEVRKHCADPASDDCLEYLDARGGSEGAAIFDCQRTSETYKNWLASCAKGSIASQDASGGAQGGPPTEANA